jgi:hypothetical protein
VQCSGGLGEVPFLEYCIAKKLTRSLYKDQEGLIETRADLGVQTDSLKIFQKSSELSCCFIGVFFAFELA